MILPANRYFDKLSTSGLFVWGTAGIPASAIRSGETPVVQ